jgi:hypothetical protein
MMFTILSQWCGTDLRGPALAAGLATCTTLTELALGNNPIGDEGTASHGRQSHFHTHLLALYG